MLTLLAALGVLVVLGLAVAGMLTAAGALHRARAREIARQIMLTDAIHAELGAVAAPVVRKRALGPWTVTLAVPFGRPALVATLVGIADRVLSPERRAAGVHIVLTPAAVVRPRPAA